MNSENENKNLARTAEPKEFEIGRTFEIPFQKSGRTDEFLTPTETLCFELQGAYSFFNRTIFESELPECMLTIEENSGALGYFRPACFVAENQNSIHQINLNPTCVFKYDIKQILSILVHEQCHLWIYENVHQKISGGYHCKRWAQKMVSVGLLPTHDGTIHGRKTGYRISHLLIQGGPFDRACDELLSHKFHLTWGKATRAAHEAGNGHKGSTQKDRSGARAQDKSKGKVKFICPECKKPCWAAPTRNLICGDHNAKLVKV